MPHAFRFSRRQFLQSAAVMVGGLPLTRLLDSSPVIVSLSYYTRPIRPYFCGLNTETITGPDWSIPAFINAIASLVPGALRYPGGEVANYWDWQTGWILPHTYKPNLPPNPYTLTDLKTAVTATGATPIYVLNMLTSDLENQITMLRAAQNLGLPVSLIELGSAFYLDGPEQAYAAKFPTGADYVKEANRWAAALKTLFPEVQVAAIGLPDTVSSGRASGWNDALFKTAIGVDAVALRHFANINTVLNIKTLPSKGGDESRQNLADEATALAAKNAVTDVLIQSFENVSNMMRLMDYRPSPMGIWLTEFGMDSTIYAAHGLWLHGLFGAALVMQYLELVPISVACLYNVAGDALNGAILTESQPFKRQYDLTPVATYTLSALGMAFQMLGQAMHGAIDARHMQFQPSPTIVGSNKLSYAGVFGLVFKNDHGARAFILNLLGDSVTVNLGQVIPQASRFTQLSGDPLQRVTGPSKLNRRSANFVNVVTLAPYSLTLIQ
jgi:hypothetical protein